MTQLCSLALTSLMFLTLSTPAFSAETAPSATPTPVPRKNSKWVEEHKKVCERYYTGKIQAGIRRACNLGGTLVDQYLDKPANVAETGCRMQYGEEPGETYACIIGARIARELQAGTKTFNQSLQLCSEYYPVRTELDAYLLESCLVGVHAGVSCGNITPERSFIGPCEVGASLAASQAKPDSPALPAAPAHRALCEKYFDHLRFHMGYRSCLNARAVSAGLEPGASIDDIRKRCDSIISDASNDHERGACLIGTALLETLKKGTATNLFDACGVNQVRYEDRDFLGCLTASSFMTYTNAGNSEKMCKEIFRDKKSLARSGCLNAITVVAKAKKE